MDIIEAAVNTISLGIYDDINALLTPSPNDVSTLMAAAIIIAKYALLALAAYAIVSRFADARTAIAATAAVMVAAVILTQPWAQGSEVSERISMLQGGFADAAPVQFTPSLLRHEPMKTVVNLTTNLVEKINDASNSVKSATTVKIPGLIELDWIFYVLVLAVAALAFYVLKTYSKYAAIAVPLLAAMVLLGLPTDFVVTVILTLALLVIAYYIGKVHPALAVYPVVVCVLLALSLVTLPTNVLIAVLLATMFVVLIPAFYFVGIIIAGFGKVLEEREKLGMKVRPKKLIEETAGQWDPVAVAVILTALFVVIIALFGANIYGVGTFVGLTVGLIRG